MTSAATLIRSGFVTKALAVCSLASFWMIPFSPFIALAAVVHTKHTVGWPRKFAVAATVLCSVFTIAIAGMLFFVTIYILQGGLDQPPGESLFRY